MKQIRHLIAALAAFALTGCETVVLSPSGDIAARQGSLLMTSVWLMLIIIVPVMALTIYFAWKYRESNTEARYEPDWDHSAKLELAIWGAPLLIIICLGALTWVDTHLMDPYRPLSRISADKSVEGTKPLEVQVIALDWKWLFIYPEQGVAAVNELALPVDRPIQFRISASSVMNAFYVPAMAGMIYAMPGMETKLHAVLNSEGIYDGFSANYSGAGFSNMRFKTHGLSDADFGAWVKKAKASQNLLNDLAYLQLEKPSEKEPVSYYGNVDNTLYPKIVNLCVERGKMCMGEMMAIDARGGLGLDGLMLAHRLTYDKDGARGRMSSTGTYQLASLCVPGEDSFSLSTAFNTRLPDTTRLMSHNLPVPYSFASR